jgi:hypothetical protein
MKPPIPYAGAPRAPVQRMRLVPTVSAPKRFDTYVQTSDIPSYSGEAVRPRPQPATAEEVKRVVLVGWQNGLLLREIAERTGISLKRVHWAAMQLMRP